jgi:hypothetical protein
MKENQVGNHQFDARPFLHVKPELVGLTVGNESQEEAHMVRNPGHADHRFRSMPIANSVSCRSPIPAMPITDSG